MHKRVYIDEAGCNRRRLELGRIRSYLELNGYVEVSRPEMADMILVGTCAFKKKEEDDSAARLKSLSTYPAKKIVLGCFPDIAPKRYEPFSHFPKVAPRELGKIAEIFVPDQHPFHEVSESHVLSRTGLRHNSRSLLRNLKQVVLRHETRGVDMFHQIVVEGRLRVKALFDNKPDSFYLMASRGCLGKCSYCAIRKSIGSVKSIPPDIVLEWLREGIRKGYTDFTVLGDDPGCYGQDIGSSLAELLHVLTLQCNEMVRAGATGGRPVRLNLKEIHPRFLIEQYDELMELQSLSLVHGLLCPIQSGSNRILELMRRDHAIDSLLRVLRLLSESNGSLDLSTQIIIGFPTETEEDLTMTLEAVVSGGFHSVVVFPYDDKEGTDAARLIGKIPKAVIRKRMRRAFRYFNEHGVQAAYSCAP